MKAARSEAATAGRAPAVSDPRTHFAGLDVLRFAAALLVAFLHLAFWSWWPTGKAGTIQSAFGSLPSFAELQSLAWFGWVGVEVFFVVSGFVISFSAERTAPTKFAIGRFVRLMPGLWLGGTIGALLLFLLGLKHPVEVIARWANSMVLSPIPFWIDGVLWSLSVEVMFYALIWLMLVANARRQIAKVMFGLGLLSGAYNVAGILGWVGDPSYILRILLLEHGCFFALGVLIHEIWVTGRSQRRSLFWIMASFCVAALWWTTERKLAAFGMLQVPIIPIVIWMAALAGLMLSVAGPRWEAHLSNLTIRRFHQMGLMTYPLYLIHSLVGGAVLLLLAPLDRWLALGVSFGVVLLVSWLISNYLEPLLQSWCRNKISEIFREPSRVGDGQ